MPRYLIVLRVGDSPDTSYSEILSDDASARHFALAALMGACSARTVQATAVVLRDAGGGSARMATVGCWSLASDRPVAWTEGEAGAD